MRAMRRTCAICSEACAASRDLLAISTASCRVDMGTHLHMGMRTHMHILGSTQCPHFRAPPLQVDSVYEIQMPYQVKQMLNIFSVVVGLGLGRRACRAAALHVVVRRDDALRAVGRAGPRAQARER